jgi:hypothetical protein
MGVVTVRILGGLGNQFYQYGAAVAIAKRTGKTVYLDRSLDPGGIGEHPRPFHLLDFVDQPTVYDPGGIYRFVWKCIFSKKTYPLISTILRKLLRIEVALDGATLDQLVEAAGRPRKRFVLSGYFQHRWASLAVEEEIRQSLYSYPSKPEATVLRDEIRKQRNTVAIHIRRGDYLRTKNAPVQEMSYYERSLSELRTMFTDCSVYLFSDDHEWASSWATNNGAKLVSLHSELEPFGDLQIMSECRHFILSDSTFSIWAYLLSRRDAGHQLICPPRVESHIRSVIG